MKFYKKEGGELVSGLTHTFDVLRQHPDAKVYVGSDSQNARHSTTYVTVIAYRYGNNGAHYVYHKQSLPRVKDKWTRLWKEVELSLEVAKWLEENSVKVHCVDLDLNEKITAGSNDLMAAARGYIIGMGFSCTVKPEEQVASRAADHLVRDKNRPKRRRR
jgi:predicted RNase H-related nuclease YkuK (DUF458 family)